VRVEDVMEEDDALEGEAEFESGSIIKFIRQSLGI
jgi:hypothetical protein